MNLKKKSFFSDNKGQSLVEFVIVLPIVLMLIFAVLSFGLFIYDRIIVVLSASIAAERATELETRIIPLTPEEKDQDVRSVANAYLSYAMSVDDSKVSITYTESNVIVKVNCKFTFILPLLDDILRGINEIPIEYTAKFRIA